MQEILCAGDGILAFRPGQLAASVRCYYRCRSALLGDGATNSTCLVVTSTRYRRDPKSVQPERITENYAALDIRLNLQDLTDLDNAYPAPDRPVRLGMRQLLH